MKVKNLNGTSGKSCHCNSWLDHWKNHGGSLAIFCYQIDCLETSLVGAHVKKYNSLDQKHYIIPLCQKHNQSSETITLTSSAKLVSANVSETCGK